MIRTIDDAHRMGGEESVRRILTIVSAIVDARLECRPDEVEVHLRDLSNVVMHLRRVRHSAEKETKKMLREKQENEQKST